MKVTAAHRLLFSLCLTPVVAMAEVSDKMSDPPWFPPAAVAVLALVLCWRWPKAALAVVPVLCALAWYVLADSDPVLVAYRREIGNEAFTAYQMRTGESLSLMPVGGPIAAFLGMRRKRRSLRAT